VLEKALRDGGDPSAPLLRLCNTVCHRHHDNDDVNEMDGARHYQQSAAAALAAVSAP
jgi:hypothetical protein